MGGRPGSSTSMPPKGLPQPGSLVAEKYTVSRLVGSGGMAHVVAATHVALDQHVAIKFLDPLLLNDADARERFAREARAMATLTSKHTVRVIDVGELPNGLPFMVMELLVGQDLHHELLERGPLPVLDACTYIEQACEAVAEAHAAGIIHRDLKPQNLFLTKVKGKPVVRVLDFGIARNTGGGKVNVNTITRLGDMLGTLQYMSPEQVRSSKLVDPRSDVWSLGACLYKLITGYPPFPQQGEAPLMAAILTLPPSPIADYRRDVPAVVASVVMRCLRKPPEERFQTVTDLAKALAEAVEAVATEDLEGQTSVMPTNADAFDADALTPHVSRRPKSDLNRTMPLDASIARRALERHALSIPPPETGPRGTVALPNSLKPTRRVDPVVRPVSAPRVAAQPPPAAPPLSFLMIVVAVAIGVFVAGLGILAVLSWQK